MTAEPFKIPCDPIAEAAAIGSAIADPTLIGDLRMAWFYDERHLALFEILSDMTAKGLPVSEVALRRRAGVAMDPVVAACVDACHSPAHFPAWRDELDLKARLRAAWQYHGAARSKIEALSTTAGPDEARELLATLETDFIDLGKSAQTDPHDFSAGEAANALIDELEAGATAPRLQTGLPRLDAIVKLRPGQLVVVAARPSVGKTALAVRVVENVVMKQGLPVGMFSLEMSKGDIMRRLASGVSGIPYEDFESLDAALHARIGGVLSQLTRAPLRICDKGGLTLAQVANLARRWKVRHDIQLLVVDYLGLLKLDGKHRSQYELITELSAGMKQLARDLDLVVVLLAQLNRQSLGSDGESERPRLHHIRDSGSVEQDADTVILLHATDYSPGRRTVNAYVEKQRNGSLGEVPLTFENATMRFECVNPIDPQDYR